MRNDGFHDRQDAQDRRERERREKEEWTAAELQRIGDRANTMECLIAQAIEDWPQFDRDGAGELNVSGADLVDWFCQWRERAKALVEGEAL